MTYLVQTVVNSITRSSRNPQLKSQGQFGPKCTIWVKNTNGIVKLVIFTIYRKNLPTLHSFC
jgi:hypothetical protein